MKWSTKLPGTAFRGACILPAVGSAFVAAALRGGPLLRSAVNGTTSSDRPQSGVLETVIRGWPTRNLEPSNFDARFSPQRYFLITQGL
jgi:hypothetical protein